jgi:hypothetical protein
MDDNLAMAVPAKKSIVMGHHRSGGGTHVGPNQGEVLLDRVRFVFDREMKLAAGGLCRALEAVAVHVIDPTVVRARDAALFDSPIRQRSAPV